MNDASAYSKAWNPVKIKPNPTVASNPRITCSRCPATIAWWAQVTVTPEVNKITVFNKGTSHGEKVSIPAGGQIQPISTLGANAE